LKERFGKGYTLTLKVSSASHIDTAKWCITSHIPNAELHATHCSTLYYRIPQQSGGSPLIETFRAISEVVCEGVTH